MAPETPARGVSSRLLTMKFMQRAAASGSSAGSPGSDAPSSKKRKLEHSPAERRIDADISQAAVQAALDDREAKRIAALEQHSTGDTHWVLKTQLDGATAEKPVKAPLNIVYVGYGEIDSDDSGDNEDAPPKGRTATRNYKNKASKKAKSQNESVDEDDSSEGSSGEDEDESPGRRRASPGDSPHSKSAQGRSRSTSQSRPKAQDPKAKEFRDKRKKKEVKLNKLLSISSGGDGQFGSKPSSNSKSMTCYNCNQVGHIAADCPNPKKDSRPPKRR